MNSEAKNQFHMAHTNITWGREKKPEMKYKKKTGSCMDKLPNPGLHLSTTLEIIIRSLPILL